MNPAAINLSLVLCCMIGVSCFAQSPERARPLEDWVHVAEDMFERVMSPTEEQEERLARVEISLAEENRVGEEMYQEFRRQSQLSILDIIKSGRQKDVRYLRALCDQIKPLMKNRDRYATIDVRVARSGTADARSFPGGRIVVTTGMLEFAVSEAELVGILAHELSHIDRGHQLERLKTKIYAEQTYASGSADWTEMAAGGALLAKQFGRPYRPDQEEDADRDAARWMYELGYDPLELARLFARFAERDKQQARLTPQFVRSHPYFVDRQDAVSGLYEVLIAQDRNRKLYVGHENLQRRVPRSEQVFAE